MRKYIALLLILGIYSFASHAQYVTPGTGVVWDMDDLVQNSGGVVTGTSGMFTVSGNITIAPEDTIRHTGDGQIWMGSSVLWTIQGVLEFDPPSELLISAQDTLQHFMGFRFEDSDASFLNNCIIEFGGGIELVNSDTRIENCVIRKNDKSNSTGVIDLFHCNPQIINNDIYLNEGPAILSPANGECSPHIEGNWLWRNNTANTNMPQINLGTSATGIDIQILGNTIEGFYDKAGGIAITTLAGGSISCMIDGNEIINNRYGITAYGFDINSTISNNIIANNNIENMPMQGGSGINFWGGTSNTSMVYGNEIYGNLWGITNTGDAMPNIGQVEPDTINPGGNSFYDNGNEGEIYALYNNTPNDIYAENNYWGSYDMDSVAMVIFDYYDDESLGIVDYMPIESPLTGVNNQSVPSGLLNIFPNPATRTIRFDLPAKQKRQSFAFRIYNDSGQMILEERIGENGSINISALQEGMYYVHLSNDEVTFTGKFVKK